MSHDPTRVFVDVVGKLNEGLSVIGKAFGGVADELTQLGYELMVLEGTVPGSLPQVIRLRHSRRWAIAGRWLVTDKQVASPRTWWERLLGAMARDVAEGRILAEAGF